MIKYSNSHSKEFTSELAPFLVGSMQLSAAGFTELVNIVMICQQNTIMDCVLNFIALETIAQIDSIYSSSLPDGPLKKERKNPLPVESSSKTAPFCQRSTIGKLSFIAYKLVRLAYVSAYYYFAPYSTPLITYMIIGI